MQNWKLLEHNTGENLNDLGYDDIFLDTIPKIWSMKKISWISLKLKNSLWETVLKEWEEKK